MSNQPTKEQLKLLYGCRCMLTGIRATNLTYHHITKKENGGKQTVGNGALLCGEIHKWLHQQEDNETFDLVSECLDAYKVCIEWQDKEALKIFEEEVVPLMVMKIRNFKKKKY